MPHDDRTAPPRGLGPNRRLFLAQLVQVLFVGMMVGMQRPVLPPLAESEFGLPRGAFALVAGLVISFGIVKAVMNFVAGQMAERMGRRPTLLLGWLVALPIPFLYLLAPSWGWFLLANALLGVNQGLAWSMTVTAKFDIAHPHERGLATGLNEFMGYSGVALAGFLAAWAATAFGARATLTAFALLVILAGLVLGWAFFGETIGHARAETARESQAPDKAREAAGQADTPSAREAFLHVSLRDRTLALLSQAGAVEKFVDALVWVLLPVQLHRQGASLPQIGMVTTIYGLVWGAGQLVTGPLSDRTGRKWPAVAGMWLAGLGTLAFLPAGSMVGWSAAAALTGIGMALLYPTLIAAVGDRAPARMRGASLGVYRFWRDLGYAIGGLVMALAVGRSEDLATGILVVGIAMLISGAALLAMEETLPQSLRRGQIDKEKGKKRQPE